MPMRRADRLFDIIRMLRTATRPLTAATLADELEVTIRTVYRDVAALQARRIPIEGAAGIGYVLKRGFDLPPLMFTPEEAVGATANSPVANHIYPVADCIDYLGELVEWAP
jgi:predicted DNA-binding transcriptional regulator YafY